MKEIKKIYNTLVKEINKREKYYSNKSASWQKSITGDKHRYITDMLIDIQESIISSRGYTDLFYTR